MHKRNVYVACVGDVTDSAAFRVCARAQTTIKWQDSRRCADTPEAVSGSKHPVVMIDTGDRGPAPTLNPRLNHSF